MTHPSYPTPTRTADNAALLDAWANDGALLIQTCTDCGADIFYPRAACPDCRSTALDWRADSGRGRVVTYTIVHRGLSDPFAAEAPVVIANIRLDSGPSMIARVAGAGATGIATGDPVCLLQGAAAAPYPLPTFCKDAPT